MSTIEQVKDEGDGFEKVDVRSQIAALNGQNRTPAPAKAQQTREEEKQTPKLNVKGLSALYGKEKSSSENKDPSSGIPSNNGNIVRETKTANDITQTESNKPPAIPSRPFIQSKNEVPPQPLVRPQGSSDPIAPPQLPPRLKDGSTSRSSTPTSINSDKGGTADNPLPYTPRRPAGGTRKGMTNSSSSGSLETGKLAPNLPPRALKSADAAQNSFTASNSSKTSVSPNPRLIQKTPGPVAPPPPRHVDAIRAPPKVATRAVQSDGGRLSSHQQFKQRRSRKRDEYGQMRYSLDPEPKDEQRYMQLYNLQIALQAQQGGSARVLEQNTIVRLWKRSRLDARFLQKVYDKAIGDAGEGIHQTEFIKAMAAIDHELARRKE